jgi:hypothetical protein
MVLKYGCAWGPSPLVLSPKQPLRGKGEIMDTTTLIIVIVVLVLLFGGGGFYWRGRRR